MVPSQLVGFSTPSAESWVEWVLRVGKDNVQFCTKGNLDVGMQGTGRVPEGKGEGLMSSEGMAGNRAIRLLPLLCKITSKHSL